MKKLVLICLLLLPPWLSQAQTFAFAAKEAVKVPASTSLLIKQYIKSTDGVDLLKDQFSYIPVFNVLNRTEKQFKDGIYYFTWGSHDSGRLFINDKGKITFLGNSSTREILADYSAFLKQTTLPDSTQTSYLSAIAAFMKFRYDDQKMLLKSGAVQQVK